MADQGASQSDIFRLWRETHETLLRSAMAASGWEQCKDLHAAWSRLVESFSGASQHTAEATARAFDPTAWLGSFGGEAFEPLFRWLESAGGAAVWPEQRRALRESREWQAYLAALERMRAIMAEAWLTAFRDFLDALARGEARPGPGGPDWTVVQRLWQARAAARLAETYRAPAFLAAQRALVRAETDLRRSLARRFDELASGLGLPSRRELDDLHRTVHELRREVRNLRRALRAAGIAGP